LRAERGITLHEAEELTGVTRETLGALEHGQRGAYTNTLQKIADGYGVTVGELLEEQALTVGKASAPPETGPATAREPIVSIPYDHDTQLEALRASLNALVVARDDAADVVPPGRLVLRDDGERIEIFLEAPSSGASA